MSWVTFHPPVPPPMKARSLVSVVRATDQPSPTAPITQSSSTSTSVKKTSLK